MGTKLWSLGCAAIQGLEIREVSRPYLEDLSSKTNELVALSVLDGQEVVYLDKIDCSQSVRAYIPIGGRAPAYCISTGKAILAHRGDHEVRLAKENIDQLGRLVMKAAAAISDELGHVGFKKNQLGQRSSKDKTSGPST